MIKKIFVLLKRIVVAILLVYAFNKMALPLNLFIPMNMWTISLVVFCGVPSIIMLILFSLVCI